MAKSSGCILTPMTLDQYSILLSVGLFAITALLVGALVLYSVVPRVRHYMHTHSYNRYLGAMAILALASVVGAFIYQLLYLTPVCELCWWQRIFLFPVAVIALVAMWYKTREAHVTIALLSLGGLFYALYHYYYHFQGLVLGNVLSLPCSTGGLLPACTESPILTFGFVTIPFMGILVFVSLLILAFFAHRKANEEKTV